MNSVRLGSNSNDITDNAKYLLNKTKEKNIIRCLFEINNNTGNLWICYVSTTKWRNLNFPKIFWILRLREKIKNEVNNTTGKFWVSLA